jgi:ubiquinone/menaquinone biosynthesis C-methylase UbiE
MRDKERAIKKIYDELSAVYVCRQREIDRVYLNMCEFKELRRLEVDHKLVLDLGCGIGRVGLALAHRNVRYIGVDISERMLQVACRLAQPNQSFVRASATALPFAVGQFSIITCIGLYEYVEELAIYLKEVRRVIRAGGDFVFTVHTVEGARRYNKLGSYGRTGWSERALRDHLTSAGFSLCSVRRAIGPLRRWRDLIARIVVVPRYQARAAKWLACTDLALCRLFPGRAIELVVTCKAEG